MKKFNRHRVSERCSLYRFCFVRLSRIANLNGWWWRWYFSHTVSGWRFLIINSRITRYNTGKTSTTLSYFDLSWRDQFSDVLRNYTTDLHRIWLNLQGSFVVKYLQCFSFWLSVGNIELSAGILEFLCCDWRDDIVVPVQAGFTSIQLWCTLASTNLLLTQEAPLLSACPLIYS